MLVTGLDTLADSAFAGCMGWHNASKFLVVGLILGLVAGFAGGYSYKNLNAEGLVTTPISFSAQPIYSFSSDDGDKSGVYGDVIMTGLANGLEQYFADKGSGDTAKGIQAVVGSSSASSFRVSPSEAKSILSFAASRTLAADRACSSIEWGWAESGILKAYENYYRTGNDVCTEGVTLNGTLSISIYLAQDFGSTSNYDISFTFAGAQTVTRWQKQPDGTCAKVVDTRPVNKGGLVWYNGALGSWTILPPGSKPWGTLICSSSESVALTYKNPLFDKSKCCGIRPSPSPTQTNTVQ